MSPLPTLWSFEDVRLSDAEHSGFGVCIPQCSEWVRLLVGRSLALVTARKERNGELFWSYLVLGVPLKDLEGRGDPQLVNEAAGRARTDFRLLGESADEFRRMLASQSWGESPEIFLQSYDLIMKLRLPTDAADWRVTDEGLTIVRWGTNRGKRFLDWSAQDLQEMERRVLATCEQARAGAQVRQDEAAAGGRARTALRFAMDPTRRTLAPSPVPDRDGFPWLRYLLLSLLVLVLGVGGWAGWMILRQQGYFLGSGPSSPRGAETAPPTKVDVTEESASASGGGTALNERSTTGDAANGGSERSEGTKSDDSGESPVVEQESK
jgi:hypothetical protein